MNENEEIKMAKGRTEGMQQGIQQGKKEIAKKLLESGMTVDEVMKITDLTKEELEKIK